MLSRPDRIGDVVISSACISPVRDAFPAAQVFFLADSTMADLFVKHPGLDGFLPLEAEASRRDLDQRFRRLGVDAIVHLNPCEKVERAAFDAGIGRRIGWSSGHASCLTDVVPDGRKEGRRLEAMSCFDLLARLGIAPPEPLSAHLSPDPAGRAEAESLRLPPRYGVLHLASHGDKPRVPLEVFGALARHLAQRHRLGVVVIGKDPEPEAVRILAQRAGVSGSVVDATGRTSLAAAAWLLAAAKVTISRDSGPAHLAAAMGSPTVTLFPDPCPCMSAARWHPLGPVSLVYEKAVVRWPWDSYRTLVRRCVRRFREREILSLVDEALSAVTERHP